MEQVSLLGKEKKQKKGVSIRGRKVIKKGRQAEVSSLKGTEKGISRIRKRGGNRGGKSGSTGQRQ